MKSHKNGSIADTSEALSLNFFHTLVSTTSGARPEVASLPAAPPPMSFPAPASPLLPPLLPPVGPEYRSAFKL